MWVRFKIKWGNLGRYEKPIKESLHWAHSLFLSFPIISYHSMCDFRKIDGYEVREEYYAFVIKKYNGFWLKVVRHVFLLCFSFVS
jgi:hypothetical protein